MLSSLHGSGTYRVLDSVECRLDEDALTDFQSRLGGAMEHFDALAGETVTVACRLDPDGDHSRWNPYAQADPVNRLIRIPTHERCTNVTIYHELAHLAIEIEADAGAEHPTTSEEFCSLFAIARQPAELIDEPRIPYFGHPDVDRGIWPHIARRSLRYREEHHDYIQKATELLEVSDDG